MLLSFDAMPLGVDYGPLGDNFWPPRVKCGPLGVNLGSRWFNLKPLRVGFESPGLDLRFSESKCRPYIGRQCWAFGNSLRLSRSQFWSLGVNFKSLGKGGVFFFRGIVYGVHTHSILKKVLFFFLIPEKKNNEKFLGENNFIKNMGVVEFWASKKFCTLKYSTPE